MNKTLVSVFFMTAILVACQKHKKNNNPQYVHSDEAEITTRAFDATTPSDTSFKRVILQNYEVNGNAEIKSDDQYIKQQKLKYERVKNELDAGKIYIFIADTLIKISKNYLQSAFKVKKNDSVLSKAQNWAREIDINESPGIFKIRNLAFDYNYEYIMQSRMKPDLDKAFSAGLFRMSSIFFNSDKTKAFVYTEIKYHRGYQIYLIKKDGKWSIVYKHLTWIT